MRLLSLSESGQVSLTKDLDSQIPPYAILSHTWLSDTDEVTCADLQNGLALDKAGYAKIHFCAEQARKDGITYFWVDTCCIDRANLTELSEAITSMFRWYRDAVKCYVYLSDVSAWQPDDSGHVAAQPAWRPSFQASRWFKRGWTLQELLAPAYVEFYSQERTLLGTKQTLAPLIHDLTKIPLAAITGAPLFEFSVEERMRWAEKRQTKKEEDRAYCLLGIFDVFMPLIYGEGDNAFRRLQKEINEHHVQTLASRTPHHALDHRLAEPKPLGLCLTSAPLIKPGDFVGRESDIEAIHAVLRPDSPVTEQRRVVLGGIGGVGKTQLAIAYARCHERSYTSVLWLNATTQSTSYASLRSVASVTIPTDELFRLNNEQMLARVHEWLSQPRNTRWLLIFDNHDAPDQLNLDRFCPNVGHGSIIVTTRLPDMVTGLSIRVQPINELDESLQILRTRSGREGVLEDEGARRLAKRLAGLPLALATAGACLRKSTMTFQQYLDTYERRWEVDPRRPPRLQDYQDRTLYTTWNLSYSRLETDDPEAAQMLKLLAYFDCQAIWYSLLHNGVAGDSPKWMREALVDQISFESLMGTLVSYCFVDVQYTTQSFSMHRCVHDWTLGVLNRVVDPQLYWYTFDCVTSSISDSLEGEDWEMLKETRFARLSLHCVRLSHSQFTSCDRIYPEQPGRLEKVLLTVRLLAAQDQYVMAEEMCTRAYAWHKKRFGGQHALTLQTINILGIIHADQGEYDVAENEYRQAIHGYEKVLGPEDILTLRAVNNLAIVCGKMSKHREAEQLYSRALAGFEKALGAEDVFTLRVVHNLGNLYRRQNRLDKAEQMCRRALAGLEKAFAPGHPSLLSAVDSLALIHASQGKLDEAEEAYLRILTTKEKAFGPDHTVTLRTVHSLGRLYATNEQLEKAEQMYMRALAGYEKTLGPEHARTKNVSRVLAALRDDQGKRFKRESGQQKQQQQQQQQRVLQSTQEHTLVMREEELSHLGSQYTLD